jgi:hypothetical protein
MAVTRTTAVPASTGRGAHCSRSGDRDTWALLTEALAKAPRPNPMLSTSSKPVPTRPLTTLLEHEDIRTLIHEVRLLIAGMSEQAHPTVLGGKGLRV